MAIVRSSSVVPPTGAGVIACSAALATAAAFSGPSVHALPGALAQDALLREVLLEAPERIVAPHHLAEVLELVLDAEELADEVPT